MEGVTCTGIIKDFVSAAGTTRVLKGVDFHAEQGKLTMLVGPSGCGKTTLICIIAGLLGGAQGTARVFGKCVTDMSAGERVRFRLAHVGFVFQQYNLLAGLTAAENVAVPLIAQGMHWDVAQKKAMQMLSRLDMEPHANKLPRQLSGGQQQRVSIARALIHEPQLLLCDEPTAALDSKSGQNVMQMLRDLAVRPDRAAIVVTHDPRVLAFADRVVHMEDGLVVKVQEAAALTNH